MSQGRTLRAGWTAVGCLILASCGGSSGGLAGEEPSDTAESAVEAAASTEAPDSSTSPATMPPSTEAEPADTTTTSTTTILVSSGIVGAPVGRTGTRSDPVPVGEIADLGDGWRLQVIGVADDATSVVMDENQFNDPPVEGTRFSFVTVALGYYGTDDPTTPSGPSIGAVASANSELDAYGCGVFPDGLETYIDVFAGGVVTGNLCFVTSEVDTGMMQLYASSGYGNDDVFLDASASPTGVAVMPTLRGVHASKAADGRLNQVSLGSPGDIGDDWTLTVDTPMVDITDAVMAENRFNDPPPDGYRFVAADITLTYNGDAKASGFDVTINASGDSNVQYGTNCGVTPSDIDLYVDVFSEGTISGTTCFVAQADDMGSEFIYAGTGYGSDYMVFAARLTGAAELPAEEAGLMDYRSDGIIDTKEWAAITQQTIGAAEADDLATLLLSEPELLVRFATSTCGLYELGMSRSGVADALGSFLPQPKTADEFILNLIASTTAVHVASYLCLEDDPGSGFDSTMPDVEYEPGEVIVDVLATA